MSKSINIWFNDLDEFEAEHIGSLFSQYEADIHAKKITAMVEHHDDEEVCQRYLDWYDEHLAWVQSIHAKMKSSSHEVDDG